MRGEIERNSEVKVTESEKAIKKKILDEYCHAKRGSIVEEIRMKLGDELIIQLLDNFSGRLIYMPNKSSLRRAALPMLIKERLRGLEPGSGIFKAQVGILADVYKLTQKSIKAINKKGIYTR